MFLSIEETAKSLTDGNVVAVPTDTVYGLAASYNHIDAIEALYELKGRPTTSPFIILLADIEKLETYVHSIPSAAYPLIKEFWPGALTLIFEANQELILPKLRAGNPTVGIRIPHHETLRALIRKTGPLAVTSANKSGQPSAIKTSDIVDYFGEEFPILSSSELPQGTESTIIGFKENGLQIFREGLIKKNKIFLHTSIAID